LVAGDGLPEFVLIEKLGLRRRWNKNPSVAAVRLFWRQRILIDERRVSVRLDWIGLDWIGLDWILPPLAVDHVNFYSQIVSPLLNQSATLMRVIHDED
jgi:hypothetical protein